MISLRSEDGISEGEMYKERISYANSEKERSFHLEAQSLGNEGISSGMNRPPSDARPLRTTSSNESYILSARCSTDDFPPALTPYSSPLVLR